jgi:hypothetical protein
MVLDGVVVADAFLVDEEDVGDPEGLVVPKILQVAGIEHCNSCHGLMENRLKLGKLIEGDVIDAGM